MIKIIISTVIIITTYRRTSELRCVWQRVEKVRRSSKSDLSLFTLCSGSCCKEGALVEQRSLGKKLCHKAFFSLHLLFLFSLKWIECVDVKICESSFPLLEFREKKIVLVTRGWQHCGELAGWWPKPLREVCPWQLLPQSQNVGKYKMQNWKSRISTKSYNHLCQYKDFLNSTCKTCWTRPDQNYTISGNNHNLV